MVQVGGVVQVGAKELPFPELNGGVSQVCFPGLVPGDRGTKVKHAYV